MGTLFLQHKIFFIFCFLLIVGILLIIIRIGQGTSSRSIDTTQERKISPLQQAIVGKTTQREIENLKDVEKKETLPDGAIRYTLVSPLVTRKNEIITKDNVVIFERILVPESKNSPGYATISEYINLFGQPGKKIQGSRYYGEPISTLVYAPRGFAFIANTITDEVYEIQLFKPMTVDSYMKLFGEDIEENPEPLL